MNELIPIIALSPVLLAVAYSDLRYMRIPNLLSLIAAAVFVVFAAILPPNDLMVRLIVAGVVFALGFLAFAFRLVGGGDVKFLPVLMLFVPFGKLAIFCNTFSAALILGIGAVLALRRLPASAGWGWKSFSGTPKFPMGISIAGAGLAFPWIALALG